MIVKDIQDETLQDYKEVAMLISARFCDWKCCRDAGYEICQNSEVARRKDIDIPNEVICERYLKNKVSRAIIFGGLEPMFQILDILDILELLRKKYHCNDTVIVYTGYEKEEILPQITALSDYKNVIVKYGRYVPENVPENVPGNVPHYDPILGVVLASSNQWAEKIS